jgi:ElaB/YqjD/DUF883 family membrane-anchored ribosome-binding protein
MGERADEITPRPSQTRAVDTDATVVPVEPGTLAAYDNEDEQDQSEETAEIRAEIEQTRAQMSDTIDTLQERLAPQTLVEQAKDTAAEAASEAVANAKDAVKEATIGRAEQVVSNVTDTARETGSSFMDTIRENPLPAALAGIGLGWLWMKRRQPRGQTRYARNDPSTTYDWEYDRRGRYAPGGQSESPMDQARHTASEVAEQMRESAGQVASHTGELGSAAGERIQATGTSVWDTVRRNPLPSAMTAVGIAWLLNQREAESPGNPSYPGRSYALRPGDGDDWRSGHGNGMQATVGEMGNQIRGAVDQAQEQVGAAGNAVYRQTRRTRYEINTWVNENPLGVAAVALGLGTAVGLAVPSTRQESELMGDARDAVMQRAREVVQDTGQKVQQVAEQATQAMDEESRSQNRAE